MEALRLCTEADLGEMGLDSADATALMDSLRVRATSMTAHQMCMWRPCPAMLRCGFEWLHGLILGCGGRRRRPDRSIL